MYELSIYSGDALDGKYKSESLPTLLRVVATRFEPSDSALLPFAAEVNHLGQILNLTLDFDLHDPMWPQALRRNDGLTIPLRAVLRRCGQLGVPDGYPVPEALNKGPGKVWVAIDRMGITDIIYMKKCPYGKAFDEYRVESRAALEAKGKLKAGFIMGDRFIPKMIEIADQVLQNK